MIREDPDNLKKETNQSKNLNFIQKRLNSDLNRKSFFKNERLKKSD